MNPAIKTCLLWLTLVQANALAIGHYPLPIIGQGKEAIPIRAMVNAQWLMANQSASQPCLPINVRNPEGNYIIPGVMGEIIYRRVNGVELSLDAYVQRRGGKVL